MSTTKVALLGAGFIADIHIESYHRFVPDAEVVAVYSRNAKRAEAFAKKHGIARSFADLDQAITQSGCEVADVCLPNFLHHRAVLAAAKAGRHVIIEKPLALALEQADEMIALNPRLSGSGKATAATVIGVVMLGLWVLGILANAARLGR